MGTNTSPEKQIYTWSEYIKDIDSFVNILSNEIKPLHIITLYRGGLPLGTVLSNRMTAPLSILKLQRYDSDDKEVSFMHNAGVTSNESIVLVDDLVDAGVTINKSIQYIRNNFPNNSLRVLTIFGKKDFISDTKIEYLREHEGKWIVFEPMGETVD